MLWLDATNQSSIQPARACIGGQAAATAVVSAAACDGKADATSAKADGFKEEGAGAGQPLVDVEVCAAAAAGCGWP